MSDSARARSGSSKDRMHSNCCVIAAIRPPARVRFVFTKDIQKVKKVCSYIPRTCLLQPIIVSGVQCDVVKLPHAVYIGPCQVVSAEMAVPIENPADCEVRDVIRFLQADEISG